MPTTLGQPYKLTWKGKPPHMLAPDIPVWWRFLEKWGFQYLSVYYDCLLGGPTLTKWEEKDPLKKGWRASLSKRADAIAITKNHVDIIEVSSDPGLRSIGQLQTYHALWLRDPAIPLPERLVMVCEMMDPDLLDAAGMYGLQVYIV